MFKQRKQHHNSTHCFKRDFWEAWSGNTTATKVETTMKRFHLYSRKWRRFHPSREASDKHTERIRKQLIYFTTLCILCNVHVQPLTFITHSGRVHFTWSAHPGICALHYTLTADWPSRLASPQPIRALIRITLRFQPVTGPQRLIKAMHCFLN